MKLETLPWLERYSPERYPSLNKSLKKSTSIDKRCIELIKACYLNERHLSTVGKQFAQFSNEVLSIKDFSLGLVSNYNIELLKYPLIASGLRYDYLFQVKLGSFNNIAQEALNPNSELNVTSDAVIVLLDHHFLGTWQSQIHPEPTVIQEALKFIQSIIEGFNQNTPVTCIVSTIPPPPFISIKTKSLIREFNTQLENILKPTSHKIFDMEALAQIVGIENWYQPVQYHLAKLSFSNSFIPLVSDKLACSIAQLNSSQKKCIILDLDNTLWGGVVGDLGSTGIAIGQGNALGEAFAEFQSWLLYLKSKGFILTVCSKNDEINAKDPFINRKDMILSLDDIVAFKANWLPKSENIRSLAAELSLGLDSFIFIDDNIMEREAVRLALPDVCVPALPEDPSLYLSTLINSGLFELTSETSEDGNRTNLYLENIQREQSKQAFTDLKSYYASLNMKLTVLNLSPQNQIRALQLINKTNQFNFTQQRFSESEFSDWCDQKNNIGLCFSLTDKFGDSGIIGVVLLKLNKKEEQLCIVNFILSCRVLGREIEHAIINLLVKLTTDRSISSLIGHYIPGIRNEIVALAYQKWGFRSAELGNNEVFWRLSPENFHALPHTLTIINESTLFMESCERA
ncbi:MAG: HAD-IIIC family phosphatase [Gammaproteobacteria bacterium]